MADRQIIVTPGANEGFAIRIEPAPDFEGALIELRDPETGELSEIVFRLGTTNGESLVLSNGPGSLPARGRLKLWATNDFVNGQVLHFRSRGKYAALIDTLGRLGLVSREIGAPGNDVSVEYVVSEDDDTPLLVTVEGEKISVSLATSGDATPAGLTTALGGSNRDLTFTAKDPGVDGNEIAVEYISDDDTEETTASATGDSITVDLAGTPGVAQSLVWNNKLVVTAKQAGVGFTYDFAMSNSSLSDSASYSGGGSGRPGVTRSFRLYRHKDAGVATETIQQVIDRFNAGKNYDLSDSADAAVLDDFFDLSIAPGAAGTDLITGADDGAFFSLTGGVAAAITATAADVKDAIEADAGADALVDVAYAPGNDGSGVVPVMISDSLSGGHNAAEVTSSAADVKGAIEALPEAAALVAVSVQAAGAMGEMAETNLSGGDDDALFEGEIDTT